MAFGLGPEGFKRKRYADIIADMETNAKVLFGEDVNLTVRSPLGLFIRLVAWCISVVWELAEKVYNSAYKDTAEGVQLDNVAKRIGLARKQAEKARYTPSGSPAFVIISGTPGTSYPAGSKVATITGIEFETIETVTLDGVGKASPKIQAALTGINGNVEAGAIKVIVNPVPGIESVTNTEAVTGGRNIETDEEFKTRYDLSLSKGGSSTVPSIEASLLETAGVRAARVVENTTMVNDAEGRPPKSVTSYVLGGLSTDIAKTILKTKAGGVQAFGTTTETVKDIAGNDHVIGFTYVTPIPIYVRLTLATTPEYPSDGDAEAVLAVIQYIGGEDTDNYYTGLTMGDDVVCFRIATALSDIPGIDDAVIELSVDGVTYAQDNIAIGQIEVAETDSAKVVVSHA